MMNKRYDSSNRVTLRAPAGGVIGGKAYRFGGLFGVAVSSVQEGLPFTLDREGVFEFNVEASDAIEPGEAIYFTAGRAGAEFTNDEAAGGALVGYALESADAGETKRLDVAVSIFPMDGDVADVGELQDQPGNE